MTGTPSEHTTCQEIRHAQKTMTTWASASRVTRLQKMFAKWSDQSVFAKFRNACGSCFAPCSCIALALLVAVMIIIVRTASNFSTFCRFHSVCASVSMFMITIDNCLFPFLCFCFCSCAGVSDSASEFSVFVQPRNQIHHRLRQPSSCSGVWDPWPCRIPTLQFEQDCNTEAMIGLFPIFAQFFSFLILESSS